MKKRKKVLYSNIIGIIAFLITLLVCVSVFLPRNVGNIYQITQEPETVCGIENIESQVNCKVSTDGEYKILGEDPQLIFDVDNSEIECVRITAVSKNDESVKFELFTDIDGSGFSADRIYSGGIVAGEQSAIIDIPKGNYFSFRLDIDQEDVVFKSLETFDEQPELVPYQPKYSVLDYIAVIFLPIISAVAVYFIDCKFACFEKLCKNISKNKIKIVTVLIFGLVALLFAVLVELIISMFTAGGTFNIYRWIFIAGIAELAVAFVFGFKCLKEKPENLFLPIVLILGTVMLFASPIKHICWDLDSHYRLAVQNSYSGDVYTTLAYDTIEKGFPCVWHTADRVYEEDIEYLNNAENIFVDVKTSEFSLAHTPSGIFIAVSRYLGANFAVKYNMGRLANLLLYSVICYFAVKKIKSGKMILSVICLFPTNLFLATNYTYDWWVTSFTILGTAYFVSELQEPDKPLTVKDTVIMALGFGIGALPKLIYIIPMGMMLFMRKNNWSAKEKFRYYGILLAVFAIVFLMFAARSLSAIDGVGDSRGGAVNPPEQIASILANPLGYAKVLFKFLANYLSIGATNAYITNYAYLGVGSMFMIPVTLMAFTALTDTNEKVSFKIPLYMKLLSVVLFVGMAALIATALYIDFTPVGSSEIRGCQARYIIPMLAPLLLLIMGKRINLIKNKSVYNGCVLSIMAFVVLAETYSMIITRMI